MQEKLFGRRNCKVKQNGKPGLLVLNDLLTFRPGLTARTATMDGCHIQIGWGMHLAGGISSRSYRQEKLFVHQ